MNYDENSLEYEFQRYADLISKQIKQEMDNPLQALTAGKNAIDAVRLLHNYAEEIKDISKRGEFMRIIGELSMELGEIKMRLGEKMEEIEKLKSEVKKLKEPTLELEFDNKLGLYFEKNKLSDRGFPFCSGCFDNNKKTIRLSRMSNEMQIIAKYQCPVCKAVYQ